MSTCHLDVILRHNGKAKVARESWNDTLPTAASRERAPSFCAGPPFVRRSTTSHSQSVAPSANTFSDSLFLRQALEKISLHQVPVLPSRSIILKFIFSRGSESRVH